jgi:hypothetical protein
MVRQMLLPAHLGSYCDQEADKVGADIVYQGDRHGILFGPTGSGKGIRFLMNNLLGDHLAGKSVIVEDPKGERRPWACSVPPRRGSYRSAPPDLRRRRPPTCKSYRSDRIGQRMPRELARALRRLILTVAFVGCQLTDILQNRINQLVTAIFALVRTIHPEALVVGCGATPVDCESQVEILPVKSVRIYAVFATGSR